MVRRLRRVVLPLLLATVLFPATPVAGEPTSPTSPAPKTGVPTQIVMSGTGPGQAVDGFVPEATFPFDPIVDGYPPSDPTTGFVPKNEGFAGIIHANPPGGGAPTLNLYCIDLHTLTQPGIGYVLGTWDASNVPNVDYVGRLLNEYYPNTNEPAGLTDVNQKAAAVQAAIWFFTDNYVLSSSSPLRATVVGIVNHIISEGPLPAPAPPSLTISPATASAPAGSIIGPFTVTSSAGSAAVTVTGGSMWSDATATTPIANGATVPSGQKIWLTSTGPTTAVLQATAEATVPRGNVYLYDGLSPGHNDAQKLILAEDATLSTTVTSTAEFLAPGSLVVTKTIGGPAAGQQGQIVIHTVCDGVPQTPDLVIPALATGQHHQTYENIPAGSVCTVTETSDGSSSTVDVKVSGDGQQVTIPPGGSASADVTDTYSLAPPGSLVVVKNIAGTQAGHQGPVTIHVVCNGTALSPDFMIPAGASAGSLTHEIDNLPAGSTCTVTETADGATSTVTVTVTGNNQQVTVPAGGATVSLIDVYEDTPGSLDVIKTIAGTAGGQQGPIAILVDCGGALNTFVFPIPAGAAAGPVSRFFGGLPAGSTCTITEVVDGHTHTVSVAAQGSGHKAVVPPDATVTANLTDTFSIATAPVAPITKVTAPVTG